MNSTYRRFAGWVGIVGAVIAVFGALLAPQPVLALQDQNDYTFTGKHEYDAGAQLKIGGEWYVGGTKITASAATLNAAASGLATNETQVAVCSNLTAFGSCVLTNGLTVYGTVTVPAASIAAAALSGNILAARITNALTTAGGSIGGNIPIAALTNAFNGVTYTNATATFTNVFINGVLTSHTP